MGYTVIRRQSIVNRLAPRVAGRAAGDNLSPLHRKTQDARPAPVAPSRRPSAARSREPPLRCRSACPSGQTLCPTPFWKLYQPAIDAEGHELMVSLPSEPLWLDGDLVRLAQVVGNLLHNAAKHTRARRQDLARRRTRG